MANFVLYNPLAGACKGEGWMEKISKAATTAYGEGQFTAFDITKLEHTEFFADKTEEDSVMLCGGDGTLNRFANDTVDIEVKCDVLYYAMGTGNDFLKDIGKEGDEAPVSVKKRLTVVKNRRRSIFLVLRVINHCKIVKVSVLVQTNDSIYAIIYR